MRRYRDQIGAVGNGDAAVALHRIAEQQAVLRMRRRGEIRDGLDRADLVVDEHRRDDAAFRDQCVIGRQGQPFAVGREDRRIQPFEALQRGCMFDAQPRDAARHDLRAAQQRPVERLGRARGKEDAPALR